VLQKSVSCEIKNLQKYEGCERNNQAPCETEHVKGLRARQMTNQKQNSNVRATRLTPVAASDVEWRVKWFPQVSKSSEPLISSWNEWGKCDDTSEHTARSPKAVIRFTIAVTGSGTKMEPV
jgi:hypothetical protein